MDAINLANIVAVQSELTHTLLPLLISAMVPKQPTAQFLDERKTLGFPDAIFDKAKFPMPAKLQRWDERWNKFSTCYIPLNRTGLVFWSAEVIAELSVSMDRRRCNEDCVVLGSLRSWRLSGRR
jgi:hypothetical protein